MARTRPAPRAWQRMLSGRRLDLLDPSPVDVEIEDIAHGLSRVARWNGQTSGEHGYSVAQHSLLVEAIALNLHPDAPHTRQLAILLHDAAEYVVGDLISPFKGCLGDGYKAVEQRILAAVMLRFGLPAEMSRATARIAKAADLIAAHYEAIGLAGFERTEAALYFGALMPLPDDIVASYLRPWPAELAKMRFLDRFGALSHS